MKSLLLANRPTGLLLSALFIGIAAVPKAFAENAERTPSGVCFDMARPATQSALGTILLNRCTGQTWMLVLGRTKNGKALAYRWRPIARNTTELAANPASVVPRVRLPAGGNSARCFTFQDRRFCE
jgi:hypothetical protein